MAGRWGRFPVWVSRLESFRAPDPWSGGSPADWGLHLYYIAYEYYQATQMVKLGEKSRLAGDFPGPGRRTPKKYETLGLVKDGSEEKRFLPSAAERLWLEGACPAVRLPGLLHAVGPRLTWKDYHFAGIVARMAPLLCAIYLAMALALLAVWIFFVPAESHRFRNVSREEWTSAAPKQEAVFLLDLVRVQGGVTWPESMMHVPAGIRAEKGPYKIGWYKAGNSHRLIACVASHFYKVDRPFGTVWPTQTAGLTPEFLDGLKAQVPDLDTSYITVDDWWWRDQNALGGMVTLWWVMAACTASLALAIFLFGRSLQMRQQRLMNELRQMNV